MDKAVQVEQVDRDAAASFYGPHLSRPGEVPVTAHMRAGKIDESPLIQAFARHRIEALSQSRGEGESVPYLGLRMSDDELTKHYEGSKRDVALVGSEVRQIIGELRHWRLLAALSEVSGDRPDWIDAQITGEQREQLFATLHGVMCSRDVADIPAAMEAVIANLCRPFPASASEVSGREAKQASVLGYHNMGSGGRCDWTHLREAVAEARSGSRSHSEPFNEGIYPGHQMVGAINYNSLDRIVTAFVEAALTPASASPEVVRLRETLRKAESGLANMIRLSDMGFTESMCEPEENGNFAGYNRAVEALAEARKALSLDGGAL